MFSYLPDWDDGPKLCGHPLSVLTKVEIYLFNGTLPKWALSPTLVQFLAQPCINFLVPSLTANPTQKEALLPRRFTF